MIDYVIIGRDVDKQSVLHQIILRGLPKLLGEFIFSNVIPTRVVNICSDDDLQYYFLNVIGILDKQQYYDEHIKFFRNKVLFGNDEFERIKTDFDVPLFNTICNNMKIMYEEKLLDFDITNYVVDKYTQQVETLKNTYTIYAYDERCYVCKDQTIKWLTSWCRLCGTRLCIISCDYGDGTCPVCVDGVCKTSIGWFIDDLKQEFGDCI
jgi:hypothetical protein